MTISIVYNPDNGRVVSVTKASLSSGINPKDMTGEGTFALVAKLPKKAAAMGTLELVKKLRVSKVLDNGTVEVEFA